MLSGSQPPFKPALRPALKLRGLETLTIVISVMVFHSGPMTFENPYGCSCVSDPTDAIGPLIKMDHFVVLAHISIASSSDHIEDQILDASMAFPDGIPREAGLLLLALKIEIDLSLMGDFLLEISRIWGHDISSLPEKVKRPKVHIKVLAMGWKSCNLREMGYFLCLSKPSYQVCIP
jgi:hypothetical protein